MRAHVGSLLRALSGELGIREDLVLDRDDSCLLVLDGMGFVIALEEAANMVILTGIVGRAPEHGHDADFFRKALHGNFYWSATAGGTLALDRSTDLCCLHLPFALPQPDSANFLAGVRNLVGAVEYWQRELEKSGEHLNGNTGLRV